VKSQEKPGQVLQSFVGMPLKRKEDARFLTGRSTFITDLKLPKVLHAVFLRSNYPHAKIRRIETGAAKDIAGVFGVYTSDDFPSDIGDVPCAIKLPFVKYPRYNPIAKEEVNFAGEIVAVVLAENEYVARDALDEIVVDYDPLPAVLDQEKAIREPPDATVHNEIPDNLAYSLKEKFGDIDGAFSSTAYRFSFKIHNQRIFSAPIETRSVKSSFDSALGELTIWTSTQYPHLIRTFVSKALNHPEDKMRVIAPDLGGGFGGKSNLYAEEIIIPYLSKLVQRPVSWVESRSESILATAHGRDVTTYVDVAVEENGRIKGMKVRILANIGAYHHFLTPAFPLILGFDIPGNYKIPAYEMDVNAIFTNKKSTDAYRGVAASEACFCMERTIDMISRELHLDPCEVRFQNYVLLEDFPYKSVIGGVNAKGDLPYSLRKTMDEMDYDSFRAAQKKQRQEKKLLGIGFSSYWELSGFGPPYLTEQMGMEHGGFESASVRILPTGKAVVTTGSSSHGQGHETAFSQIAADALQLSPDDISVLHGDTLNAPYGIGTFASRSAALGGTAIKLACDKIVEKCKIIAAFLLSGRNIENSRVDLVGFEKREFFDLRNASKRISFKKIVEEAYLAMHLPPGVEPGLEAVSYFNPQEPTYASGTHSAMVEVDVESGLVKVLRYVAVNDFGTIINPLIVEGQIHGGIVQGTGQALLEEVKYGEDNQLLTVNFLDYLVPTAMDPFSSTFRGFETSTYQTETLANPLGVKGMGESGAIAAPAAVVNAVEDALMNHNRESIEMPLSPEKVWRKVKR
jgi:aerobic carbon-monoxide dehydrogenase large subunit